MSEHVYMVHQTFYFKRARKILFSKICLLYWIESAYIKEISEPDIKDDDEKNEAPGIAAGVTSFVSSDARTHTHTPMPKCGTASN